MKNQIILAIKGFAMGCADVVPGVSGGTIALLTGIYQRLINAISSVDIQAIKLFFSGEFKKFWSHIDGNFLFVLFAGIITAIVSLSHSIKYALEYFPILTWSFFFGLIIASALLIIRDIPNKIAANWLWLIPGIIIGFYIGSQTSLPFISGPLAIFLAAMIAISAMILPGISGSFILILIGAYQPLLNAVTERDYSIILIFICGAAIGLLLFSRVVKWLLKSFYNATLFFLSGLMLGSLVKIWPWKNQSSDMVYQINVMPNAHSEPQLFHSVLLMLLAFILVFGIDYLGKRFLSEKS